MIAPDRLGWGSSEPPEGYVATTISEQAEHAATLLSDREPAIVCGAGIGAVIALDLLVGRPDLIAGAVLVEPPLLSFSDAATEALSKDRMALEVAHREGGPRAASELYLSGELGALGPGVGRLPAELTAPGLERPTSLFAELGAVPAWSIPLAELKHVEHPSRIAVSSSTPLMVREACEGLARRLAHTELREVSGQGPPHLGAPGGLAELVLEISPAREKRAG